MSHDVYTLPTNLPVPEGDGAADHLTGLELPDLELDSSQGRVNVGGFDVIFFYPVFPPDRNAGDVLAYLRSR